RATYHADTGHFINNTDGTPGFQRVNDVEYLLLTPEHRAIAVQQLTESTTRTRQTPPDTGDTDLTVLMVPDIRLGHVVVHSPDGRPVADVHQVTLPGSGLPGRWYVPRDGGLPHLEDAHGVRVPNTPVVPLAGRNSYLVHTPDATAALGPDGARTHQVVPLSIVHHEQPTDAVLLRPLDGNGVTAVHDPETGALLTDRVLTGFDGARHVVEHQGATSVHAGDGAFLQEVAGRVGNPLGEGHHLVTAGPDGRPFVAGPDGAPVPGATAARLDEDMYLVRVPGWFPGVVDARGQHTHDVIVLAGDPRHVAVASLRGGAPELFATDGGRPADLSLRLTGGELRLEPTDRPHSAVVHDMAGSVIAYQHRLPDGHPFAGHDVFLATRAGQSWLRAPSGEPVPDSAVFPVGDTLHLIRTPDHGPFVLDSRTGAQTHDAVRLVDDETGDTWFAIWPMEGGGPVTVLSEVGRPVPSRAVINGGHIAVETEGNAVRFYDMDGVLRDSGDIQGGVGVLNGHLIAVPETERSGAVWVVRTGDGTMVENATATQFGSRDLVVVPGAGRALFTGEQIFDVVPIPGGTDRFLAVPPGARRTDPSDEIWLDGAAVRIEEPNGSATFHAADGTVLGRSTFLRDGLLDDGPMPDHRAVWPSDGVPRLVDVHGNAVEGGAIRPLDENTYLVTIDDVAHAVINDDGRPTHDIMRPDGRDGAPGDIVLARPLDLTGSLDPNGSPVVYRGSRVLAADVRLDDHTIVVTFGGVRAVFGADGAFRSLTVRIDAPALDGFSILDIGQGSPLRLLDANDTVVGNATVTRPENGDFRIDRGGNHYVVGEGGDLRRHVIALSGREDHPDLVARIGPEGLPSPHPRTTDGTTLTDHVVRFTGPPHAPTSLYVHGPDQHLSVYDPTTGVFHGDVPARDLRHAGQPQAPEEPTGGTALTTDDIRHTLETTHIRPGSSGSDGSGSPGPARHGMGDSDVELTELPHLVRLSGHDGRPTGTTLSIPPGGGAPTLTRDGQPVTADHIRITERSIGIRTGATTTFHGHDGRFLADFRTHHTGPLTGHVVIAEAGQSPRLIRFDGQPSDTLTTTRFGNHHWRVDDLGTPRALLDNTGHHTHDVTRLTAPSNNHHDQLDEYVLTPLTGDRTPTLHQGDGTPLPHRVEPLDGGLLAIHRADTTADIHDTLGSHHATLHRLPGDEHHELITTGDNPPRVIGPDGETVPGSRATPLPDDTRWLIHRPDHTPLITDRTGNPTHTTVRLTDTLPTPHPTLIALPTHSHHGPPHLISASDGTRQPGRVTVHPEPGWITVQLDDGHRVLDMTGAPLPQHHVFAPEGHVTADSLMIRVNGQGSPDVLDMTGRPVPHTTTPFGSEAHLVRVPGYPSTFVTAEGRPFYHHVRAENQLVALPMPGERVTTFRPDGQPIADVHQVTVAGSGFLGLWYVPRNGSPPLLLDANWAPVANTRVVRLEGLDSYLVRTPRGQIVLGRDGTITHELDTIRAYANQLAVNAVLVRPVDGNGVPSVHDRATETMLSDRVLTSLDGRRTTIEYQGPISAVYNDQGRLLGSSELRIGNPLGEGNHLVTRPDGSAFVADRDGTPVPGTTATRLDDDMYLITTLSHRPGVVNTQNQHTHDVIELRTPRDRFAATVSVPRGHFVAAPLDGGTPRIFTPDGSPATGLRLEPEQRELLFVGGTARPHITEVHNVEGHLIGFRHDLVDGPLLDHQVFLTGRQETSWVRGPEGDRVLDARVTPLGGDRHLITVPVITVPDRPPVVLDTSTGAGQHIAVQLAPGDGGASRGIAVWPR
ncbi:hypothetical protein, partial [Streptomyces radicis]